MARCLVEVKVIYEECVYGKASEFEVTDPAHLDAVMRHMMSALRDADSITSTSDLSGTTEGQSLDGTA